MCVRPKCVSSLSVSGLSVGVFGQSVCMCVPKCGLSVCEIKVCV